MFLLDESYWHVQSTPTMGRGVFAKRAIQAGQVIGDYIGTVLRTQEYDLASDARGLYLMYLTDDLSLYPNLHTPGIHLLNHSCAPNCWMYMYQGHTLFFAISPIRAGEQLTIHYLLNPKEDGCPDCIHDCLCQSSNCTGTMHLSPTAYSLWQTFQNKHPSTLVREPVVGRVFPTLEEYPHSFRVDPIYQKILSS